MDVSDLPEGLPKVTLTEATHQPTYQWDLIWKYSSLVTLLRITGRCIIVCNSFKNKGKTPIDRSITPEIINQAKQIWIRETQRAYFGNEFKLISKSKLPQRHIFNRLTAYVESTGIIRVGGRLGNIQVSAESQHPAILPRRSPLTTLIIRHAHVTTLHSGAQIVLAYIRKEFWIIGGRAPVKSQLLQCVTCSRYRAHRAQQLMGQLLKARVTPSRPFTHTGIDYAGPFTIKSWKGRGSKTYKSWICIFVCFSTSAVHIETVMDYTTDSFIAAYLRFISRRGISSQIYSDQGTNFIGADRELRSWFRQAQQEDSTLFNFFSTNGTRWSFNPPAAPHMGGKWEAVVKSIKYHLRRVTNDMILTSNEATTLFAQIEAVLNSRPLEPLSKDPADVSALTPGHFLIGEPLNAVPQPSLLNLSESRLSRWQLVQQRTQQFWRRWSTQ